MPLWLWLWLLLFIVNSLYCWWIIGFGGARWIKGWKSFFLIEWFTLNWNAEQIRLYVLIIWLASVVLFVVGIMNPELRSNLL